MTGVSRVLHGARVRCMDDAGTLADAIAWRDGAIIAVGRGNEVREAAGEGAEIIDAGGATVLPGFVDPHHHVSLATLYGGVLRVAPPRVTDIAGLQAALAAAAARLPAGRMLVAMDWDEVLLAEGRPPHRRELDDAVPDRPLFAMHYTCHRGLANSRALELAGIDRHTPDPAGGRISRDPDGSPDGLLIERGMSPVEARARAELTVHDREDYLDRLAEHYRAMLAAGITRVGDATVPADLLGLYRESAARGEVLVPTHVLPVSTAGYLEEPWEVLDGPVTGEEEGPLVIGPVKLVFDGAPECSMCMSLGQSLGAMLRTVGLSLRRRSLAPAHTALSLKPRLEGGKLRSGIAIYRREEADRMVRAAAERGFGLAVHAIGNEAIDVALSAYEKTGPALHRAALPRIEHAAFLDRRLVDRLAACGAAVVTQPYFLTLPAWDSAAAIPGIRSFAHRWLLDAGVPVAGSSDYPVAGFAPLDGIRSAITRRTRSGHPYDPDQGVALDEALALYTRGAARALGCLDRCGTLEVGKRADLVILDRAVEGAADLEDATVRTTIVGGRTTFELKNRPRKLTSDPIHEDAHDHQAGG